MNNETTIVAEKIGDNFLPLRRFRRDPLVRALLDGERVEITVRRIRGTHATDDFRKRYFATLRELWDQLPEEIEARYPSSEHLRKAALCWSGFADKKEIVAKNDSEARKIAAIIAHFDGYAIVDVTGTVVSIWTAWSQSRAGMPDDVFRESANKVLDMIAKRLGVSRPIAERHAGRSA